MVMSQDELFAKGEALGRKDGARRWGMLPASEFLHEAEWAGYQAGYYSTTSL